MPDPTPVHGTIEFFAPDGEIDLSSSHWTFQDGGAINTSADRDSEPGKDGDELLATLHNSRSTTSFSYVHDGTGTYYTFPKIGSIPDGWHIDSIRCIWDRSKARAHLTVNCHKHNAGANHTTAPRKYTPSLAQIPVVSFGVPAVFTGGSNKNAFTLDQNAVVDLRTATYDVSCTHIDEPGRNGNVLKSNNHDGVETLSLELTGSVLPDDYTTDWSQPASANTPSNSGVTTSSLTLEHHIAHD